MTTFQFKILVFELKVLITSARETKKLNSFFDRNIALQIFIHLKSEFHCNNYSEEIWTQCDMHSINIKLANCCTMYMNALKDFCTISITFLLI